MGNSTSKPKPPDDHWLGTHLACHHCAQIVARPVLEAGQRARCPRCGYLLTSNPVNGLNRALAFALSALIFIWLANLYPFLAFRASGLENMITLPASALELYREGSWLLAGFVIGFIIVVPTLMTSLLSVLLIALAGKRRIPGLTQIARMLFTLSPWSMAEVFIISVIVALVKLSSMASIELGLSFWAYILFTLCFTAAFANVDRLQLWAAIKQAGQ